MNCWGAYPTSPLGLWPDGAAGGGGGAFERSVRCSDGLFYYCWACCGFGSASLTRPRRPVRCVARINVRLLLQHLGQLVISSARSSGAGKELPLPCRCCSHHSHLSPRTQTTAKSPLYLVVVIGSTPMMICSPSGETTNQVLPNPCPKASPGMPSPAKLYSLWPL